MNTQKSVCLVQDNGNHSIREVRLAGRMLLRSCSNEAVRATPELDTDCLLQFVLHKDRSWLFAHDDALLAAEQLEQLNQLFQRRLTGFPIAYLIQEKEFYGYSFYVTPAVLIPKPDTEILVERAVELICGKIAEIPNRVRDDKEESLTVVDMCTGSGCIAISVLLQLYQRLGAAVLCNRLMMFATDISLEALDVARGNARRLLPEEIAGCLKFCQGNLWSALPAEPSTASGILRCESGSLRCHVLLTNPPYVPTEVTSDLLTDGRSEPRLALDGGTDGLNLVRTILEQAPQYMAPGSVMLLETGEYNAEEAARLAESAGFTHVRIHKDLAGMLRLTEAAFPG